MLFAFIKRLIFGRKISQGSYKKFQIRLKEIEKKDDYRKIIECDKLYHHILKELGYKGSFGTILKKNPREIGDIESIWRLHKVRNKIVHDEQLISENILSKEAFSYYSKTKIFLENIKKHGNI